MRWLVLLVPSLLAVGCKPKESREAKPREEAPDTVPQSLAGDLGEADAHNQLGVYWAQEGDYEKAELEFKEALRLDPDHPEANANYGALLLLMERYPEAERHLRRAVELDPENGKAHGDLGVLYLETGRYRLAKRELRRAVELLPEGEAEYYRELLRELP